MTEIAERLDRAEADLARLQLELHAIRRLATAEPAPEAEPAPPAAVAPPVEPAPQPTWTPPAWTPPAPRRQRRQIDLAVLFGPRALAWAGGIVTLLGVVFIFVLAANRGWIGPVERVGLGALASALVFVLALVGQRRYGALYAVVAAAGAGIAGGYATLLVAAARYDLLDALPALGIALAIATAGTAVALAWRSETVAAIGLVGAILVPLVTVLDGGVTPLGTAFAAFVLCGAAVVGVRMEWRGLLAAAGASGALQIALLVLDEGRGAPARVVVLTAVYVAVLLAIGLARGPVLDALARAFVLGSATLAGIGIPLLLQGELAGLDARGVAFVVAAAAYLAVATALFTRREGRDAAALVGALGLSLGVVAAAYLLDGPGLVVAWSAQAVLLAWLAGRVGEARIGIGALAYLALAIGHTLMLDAPVEQLLEPSTAPASGIAAVLAATAAAAALAPLARRWPDPAPASGAVSLFVAGLVRPREELALVTAAIAAAGAAYAAALGILELAGEEFGWGQVAVLSLWGAAAALALEAGVRLGRAELRIAGLAGAAAVLVELALVYELLHSTERGVAGLVAAATVLAAAVLHERRSASVGLVAIGAPLSGLLVLWAAVQLWWGDELGFALAILAVPYVTLAVGVAGRRDLSTVLWSTGLALALPAPALVTGGGWVVLAWSLGAVALAGLAVTCSERRLLAAAVVPLGCALALTAADLAPPVDLLVAGRSPGNGVAAVLLCALALVAVAAALRRPFGKAADRFDRFVDEAAGRAGVLAAAAGGVALYGLSLGVLAAVGSLTEASLDAEFKRGHTAVSTLWGAVALALLVAGLTASSRWARLAGLVLLAVTLAKIFLFDLARLDSVTRALSFLAVGSALLLAGFFTQRLAARRDVEPNGA
jgi:uncharacterized membrane protein